VLCYDMHDTSCAMTCITPSSHVSSHVSEMTPSSHVSWLSSKHDMHHRWEVYISLVSGISLVRCCLCYISSERHICMQPSTLSLRAGARCLD